MAIYDVAANLQQFNPLNAYAQGANLAREAKDSKSRNALMQLQLQDAQVQAGRRNYGREALAALNAEGKAPDASSYLNAYMTDAAKAGDFEGYAQASDKASAQSKAQREADAARLTGLKAQLDVQGQLLGSVQDQASYDAALAQAQQAGMDVTHLPREYSPQTVSALRQRAMTAAQQAEQEWKQKGYSLDVAKFGYQQQNDAANRGVTLRGQNMANERSREANAIKAQSSQNDLREGAAATDIAMDSLETLRRHPGLRAGTGSVLASLARNIPGTDAKGFAAQLEQFKSQTFLPAVQQMKGMGQLSNAEGAALQKAVGNLDPDMPTAEFQGQAAKIMAQMRAYRQRKYGNIQETQWDGRQQAPAAADAKSAPRPGSVQGGYLFRGGDPADPKNWSKAR